MTTSERRSPSTVWHNQNIDEKIDEVRLRLSALSVSLDAFEGKPSTAFDRPALQERNLNTLPTNNKHHDAPSGAPTRKNLVNLSKGTVSLGAGIPLSVQGHPHEESGQHIADASWNASLLEPQVAAITSMSENVSVHPSLAKDSSFEPFRIVQERLREKLGALETRFSESRRPSAASTTREPRGKESSPPPRAPAPKAGQQPATCEAEMERDGSGDTLCPSAVTHHQPGGTAKECVVHEYQPGHQSARSTTCEPNRARDVQIPLRKAGSVAPPACSQSTPPHRNVVPRAGQGKVGMNSEKATRSRSGICCSRQDTHMPLTRSLRSASSAGGPSGSRFRVDSGGRAPREKGHLPLRVLPNTTVLVSVSTPELLAILRLRGWISSYGETSEELFPPSHCHTLYITPSESRQLAHLRVVVSRSKPSGTTACDK